MVKFWFQKIGPGKKALGTSEMRDCKHLESDSTRWGVQTPPEAFQNGLKFKWAKDGSRCKGVQAEGGGAVRNG